MDIGFLRSDWAAWAALLLSILVTALVMRAIFKRSARGQLNHALRNVRESNKALHVATKDAQKANARLEKLSGKSDKVKPRILQEARDTLEDCRALVKILDDKNQVTTNHLRRVIYEEYPPSRHEKLRRQYLPQDIEDDRPFSF